MRIYALIFFLLYPSLSVTMEIEKTPKEGFVFEDATELIRRHARVYVLQDGTIKFVWISFIAADVIFTVFPGLILALPFSLECSKAFGNHENGSFVPTENSTLATNGTNVDRAKELCHLGLGFSSVPALAYLGTLCSYPLLKMYQVWAAWMNRRIDEKIDREFVKGRLKTEILDETDIRYIAELLFKEPYLLERLSLNQSLILAEVDLHKFHEEIDNFSVLPQQYAQKLFRFLEMSNEQLVAECANEKVHAVFRQNPSLWQALARILWKNGDETIIHALRESLRKTLPFEVDEPQLDKIFKSIVQKGNSINNIVLKAISIQKYQKDSKITIIHGKQEWSISRNRLNEISNFFKVATTESWRKKKKTTSSPAKLAVPILEENIENDQIDLSSTDVELVKILVSFALDNTVEMTKKTIIANLDAADYFEMPDLVIRCDNFIKENNLSDAIFQVYEPGKSLETKLIFCKKFGLLENYKALVLQTINRLDYLELNDLSVLHDISLLNSQEQMEIAKMYNATAFIKKCGEPKFLNVVWPVAKTIAFLRDGIVKFCRVDRNKDTVEKAWVTIPDDLEKAMAEY